LTAATLPADAVPVSLVYRHLASCLNARFVQYWVKPGFAALAPIQPYSSRFCS
jgi:hypothetical protein